MHIENEPTITLVQKYEGALSEVSAALALCLKSFGQEPPTNIEEKFLDQEPPSDFTASSEANA